MFVSVKLFVYFYIAFNYVFIASKLGLRVAHLLNSFKVSNFIKHLAVRLEVIYLKCPLIFLWCEMSYALLAVKRTI